MVIKGEVHNKTASIKSKFQTQQNIDGNINKATNVYVKELEFKNHYEFPAIGEPNKLYIAKDESAIYRFNDTNNTYVCIGRDYTNIEIIQGVL